MFSPFHAARMLNCSASDGAAALADPAQAAAIRDLVIHWYRAHLWKNTNRDIWISEYLIKDQRLSEADAKVVADSDGSNSRIPGLKAELLATQQDTIDLLQSAGQFKGKALSAEGEFDPRFADINEKSRSAKELEN